MKSRVPHVPRLPGWILALTALVAALTVTGQVVDPDAAPSAFIYMAAAIGLTYTTMAAVVLSGAPGHLVGRLMAGVGGISCVAVVAASWSGWLPLAWLSRWSWWPPLGLSFLALLVFPDGRLPTRRWRPLAAVITAATVTAGVALALAALDHPRTLLTAYDEPVTPRADALLDIARLAILVTFAGAVGVLCSLFLRWRRADGEARHQLACLLPSGVLFLVALVVDTLDVSGAWVIAAVVVPLGMTVAILRYRLYELDRVINRTIVWLVMSLMVVAGFVALVTALHELVLHGDESNASLVATAIIAVAFEPLRRSVQRGVDRLLYGDRDDPYKVIAELGDLLGRTADTRSVLPLLASTIARSLQVSYVAVVLDTRDGARMLAEHGSASTPVESFDMVVHGDRVGRLIVATRSAGSRFTPRERRLLSDVALQAAVAAEATRLIGDLQYSRERLIMAREEERRRIRRDLHDGLGPSLAGMSMQVRAANRLAPEQTRVAQILQGLEGDLRSCASEMRQLVDQLRPPALDNGLEAALHAECQRFASGALSVRLTSSDDLSGLPAAIEVASYRIVAEALTNVVRHSGARTCEVTIHRSRSLRIAVTDDGVGLRQPARDGVGLTSMRERAAEVGGECTISDADPHGTVIEVELPLTSAPVPASQKAA